MSNRSLRERGDNLTRSPRLQSTYDFLSGRAEFREDSKRGPRERGGRQQ